MMLMWIAMAMLGITFGTALYWRMSKPLVFGACSDMTNSCRREKCRDLYCCCDCHFDGGLQ